MKKQFIFRWSVILFTGLSIAISLWAQIRYDGNSSFSQIITALGAFITGIGSSFLIIRKIVEPRLRLSSPKIHLRWLVFSLAAGFFLVYTIPLTLSNKVHTIQIIATGEKNPLSAGSEVWLANISGDRRTPPQDLSRVCQGDWLAQNNMRIFLKTEASKLTCSFRIDDDTILVTLGTHAWSGKARLLFEGQVFDLDLYSPEGGIKKFSFQNPISRSETSWRAMMFFASGISISMILFTLSLWFATRNPYVNFAPRTCPWYGYSLPIGVSWLIALLVFWPGFLSPDPLYQLEQIVNGQLNDWHPAFHTLVLWLFTRVWFSPAPIILAQILFLSGLIGWGLSLIEKDHASPIITWSAAGFLALSPAISLMILNPWKDIAYAIAISALTLLLFRIISSQGTWIEKPISWISLGIAASLVAIFRHNGTPVALGTLAILLLSYPKQWKRLGAAIVVSLAIWAGIRGPLYKAVGVETSSQALGSNLGVEARIVTLIDLHYRSGTQFLPEEKYLLPENLDLESWGKYSSELRHLAIRLTFRNPIPTLEFLLDISDYILQIYQPPDDRIGYVEPRVYDNSFGIQSDSKIPRLQPILLRIAQLTEVPKWDWLFWRNAFWMYLLCWAALVACTRRKSWKYFLITIPILLNALPLPLGSGGQISRYILATLLVSPLFSGYLLTISPSQDHINHIE